MQCKAHDACNYVKAKVEVPKGYVLHLKANDHIQADGLVTHGGCTDHSMSTGSPLESLQPIGRLHADSAGVNSKALAMRQFHGGNGTAAVVSRLPTCHKQADIAANYP